MNKEKFIQSLKFKYYILTFDTIDMKTKYDNLFHKPFEEFVKRYEITKEIDPAFFYGFSGLSTKIRNTIFLYEHENKKTGRQTFNFTEEDQRKFNLFAKTDKIYEKIAKSIVFNEVDFPQKKFGNRSKEVINLIKKCLTKEPKNRIKIDEILKSDWIQEQIGAKD